MLNIMNVIAWYSLEHNLPDSPFASPTKAAAECISAFSNVGGEANLATPYLPGASILDVGTFKSFNCQVPRYSHSVIHETLLSRVKCELHHVFIIIISSYLSTFNSGTRLAPEL